MKDVHQENKWIIISHNVWIFYNKQTPVLNEKKQKQMRMYTYDSNREEKTRQYRQI